MHYCLYLFTKKLPSNNKILEIMKPYDEEDFEYDVDGEIIGGYPVFSWDWYQIGGRYKGDLKLKVDKNDKYYHWEYYAREPRNNRLFISSVLTTMKESIKPEWMFKEEDYFSVMGMKDGILYVDGARCCDIKNYEDLDCYICIDDIDNLVIARDTWNGNSFVKNEKFDDKLHSILENRKDDGFLTVIDIHD